LCLKTLDLMQRVLGEDHLDTLRCMSNLAIVNAVQGRDADAERGFRHVLETRRRVLGDEHPDTLAGMHNLARLYCDRSRYLEAEPLCLKAVELASHTLGESHPSAVKSLNLLISLYEAWGKPEEAGKWRGKLSQTAAQAVSGRPAPSFTLQDLQGRQLSLSDFRGKVVLLDFWATWCSPCVKAIPYLEAFYQKYREEGLVVIGLNTETDHTTVGAFAKGRISYPVLLDAGEQFNDYGVRGIPTLVYVDRGGVVRSQQSGFAEGRQREIEAKIKELLRPYPADQSDVGPLPMVPLRWLPVADAVAHRVYFGPDPQSLLLLGEAHGVNTIDSPALVKHRWYCWRVDALRRDGSVVEGARRSFSTGDLVGWWRFDETEGRTAQDSSGRGHHAALIGAPQWQPGRLGGALAFDGQDDYVSVKEAPDFDITREITVACWIKVATFDIPWQALIAKGNQAWRVIRSIRDRSAQFACTGVHVRGTIWGNVDGKVMVDDGQWHQLTGVYDGAYVRLYVDGVLDASVEGTGTVNVTDDYVLIGANAGDQWRYCHGLIDEVRVYSYALSEEEVQELSAGRGPASIAKPAWLENK
jgi:thiol-disulfide isomerase/thioredoxin